MTEKKWYVYLLCDPDTEEPFYVGKGTGNRMYAHEKRVNSRSEGNSYKKEVIGCLLAEGKQVLKKKVAEFDIELDALIYEFAMISLYGDRLVNIKRGVRKPQHSGNHCAPAQTTIVGNGANLPWSIEDAMFILSCSPTALWRYMHCDGLPFLKLGGKTSRVQFRPEAVRKWVEDREIVMVAH